MAQWSTTIRNLWITDAEATIGTTPVIKIRTGSAPANCAASDSGTVLATINLPSDWLSAPSTGSSSKLGTWEDVAAEAGGTAGHFRLYSSGGTCHLQGTVGTSGTDMVVSSTVIVPDASFTVTSFLATSVGA
jgi:hypothetical protein